MQYSPRKLIKMQYHRVLVLGIAALCFAVTTRGKAAANGATEIDGNWYGNVVNAIRYDNVDCTATYSSIVAMSTDGTCVSVPETVSGPLAPFSEEVCAPSIVEPDCGSADSSP